MKTLQECLFKQQFITRYRLVPKKFKIVRSGDVCINIFGAGDLHLPPVISYNIIRHKALILCDGERGLRLSSSSVNELMTLIDYYRGCPDNQLYLASVRSFNRSLSSYYFFYNFYNYRNSLQEIYRRINQMLLSIFFMHELVFHKLKFLLKHANIKPINK